MKVRYQVLFAPLLNPGGFAARIDYYNAVGLFLPIMKSLPPRCWSILVLGLTTAWVAFAGEPALRIAVRSEVDRPFEGWGKAPLREHGKTYHLVYLDEHKSPDALLKPVNPDTVRKVMVSELTKRGFQAVPMNGIPDILLAVDYGRDFLRNPYHKDFIVFDKTVTLTGVAGLNYFARERSEAGFTEKVQNADHEKLFIRVIAWANPRNEPEPKPGKRKKLHEVWRTTVVIDNPADRDLNLFLEKMLAAASPLFDHPTKDEEEIINTDLPEGYIKIGEAKVMPDQQSDHEKSK